MEQKQENTGFKMSLSETWRRLEWLRQDHIYTRIHNENDILLEQFEKAVSNDLDVGPWEIKVLGPKTGKTQNKRKCQQKCKARGKLTGRNLGHKKFDFSATSARVNKAETIFIWPKTDSRFENILNFIKIWFTLVKNLPTLLITLHLKRYLAPVSLTLYSSQQGKAILYSQAIHVIHDLILGFYFYTFHDKKTKQNLGKL